jgi:hypothetical protein
MSQTAVNTISKHEGVIDKPASGADKASRARHPTNVYRLNIPPSERAAVTAN